MTAKSGRSGGGRPGGGLAAGHTARPAARTRPGFNPTRLALALHEAGHAVVGAVYGASTEQATLSADGSHGFCTFTADASGPSAYADRPRIAAAGAVAAAMLAHGPGRRFTTSKNTCTGPTATSCTPCRWQRCNL